MKKVLAFVMCVMISISSFTLAFAANGTWIKSGSRWWYKHSDGSYTRNNWEQIDGKWYFFDNDGWMKTGWLQRPDGRWYYLNNDGSMRTTKLDEKGAQYYFDSINGFMYKTELNVIRYEQEKSNWCWAASIQMVGGYKTKYVSQESIVQYVKGNLNNTGANIAEIKKGIDYVSGNDSSGYSTSMNAQNLRAFIDNRRPFISGILWRDSGGHAIVGCGYDTKEGVFWFKDPGVGVTPFYKVSSQAIDSNTYFQYGLSGFGKYNSTNYYYK